MSEEKAKKVKAKKGVSSQKSEAKPEPKNGDVPGNYNGSAVHQKQLDAVLKQFAGQDNVRLTAVSRFSWPKEPRMSEAVAAKIVRWMAENERVTVLKRGAKSKKSPNGSIPGPKFKA